MVRQVQVSELPSGQLAVVALAGEFDLTTADELRRTLAAVCGRMGCTTVLDLAHLTFMDSSILGVLAGAHKLVQAAGGRLIAVNVTGMALTAMTITGLTQTIEVYGPGRDVDDELAGRLAELAHSG